MSGARIQPNKDDRAAKNAREEMLLFLFRDFSKHQQRELIMEMHAMYEANAIARAELDGKPLRTVSNEQVRALFGDVPPVAAKRSKKKRGPSRGPGDEMGDYPDE